MSRVVAIAACIVIAAIVACKGDGRTVLTIYSPHGADLLTYYEQEFEKANPTIDVQWVDIGSQEVLERIRVEASNPQADLWFGAPGEAFDRAVKENLLEPYSPTWAAQVPPEARDSAANWFGTYLTPEVIGYNSEAVADSAAPKDWDDVLDPKWKGKILIRDPIASGSMRAIFGAIIARSIMQTGKPDSGYAWLRRLDANTKEYTLNPSILYTKLGRQEGVLTLWNMPDIATLKQRLNLPIKAVIPSSGTPLLVDGIALVRGTKRAEEAKRYYEFVTTPEALIVAADSFLRIPARTDVPVEKLPQWIQEARTEIKPMPLDRKLIADHLDEWMTYWDQHIRNSGRRK